MPSHTTAAFPPAGLATERLLLRTPRSSDAYALLAYYIGNRAHLRRWEPARTPAFYTEAAMAERLEQMALHMEQGRALHLLMVRRDSGALVGHCHFSNIVRAHAQSCQLGFGLGMPFEGQGLMHEALVPALRHMFEVQGLHRIAANHMPENLRCERLLARLGFEREGLARAYLHINGAWRDHVLNALINEDAAMR